MADVAIVSEAVASTPEDYKMPGAQEILLKAVGCTVNGSSASGTFLPALQMLDPAGHVMWTAVNTVAPVAAGGSALVSWFPGGSLSAKTTTTSGGSGGSGSTGQLQVTDGTTVVGSVVDIDFVSGATVTSGGAGVANVTARGSGTTSFSGARVYSSAVQSIPNNTDTYLNFDTVRYDIGGYTNLGTFPQRLTAPVTGWYMIGGSIAFPNGDFYSQIVVALNGSLAQDHQLCGHTTSVPAGNNNLCINTIWKLNAGDYVGLDVVQASGAAANSESFPPQCPEFWIALLGI